MPNKRVFEYEPMQSERCYNDGADESIFRLGVFRCGIASADRSYLEMRHGRGYCESIVRQYTNAEWLRGLACMLLSAADALDDMQAMKQKKKDEK